MRTGRDQGGSAIGTQMFTSEHKVDIRPIDSQPLVPVNMLAESDG
jgi:hypothetical protein